MSPERRGARPGHIMVLLLLAGLLLPAVVSHAQLPPVAGADPLLNRYYMQRDSNPQAARDALRQAMERYPDDARPALEYGYLMLRETDNDAAVDAFRRAVRVLPSRADLWAQIGYIEINRDRRQDALEAFRIARRLAPENTAYAMQAAYLESGLGLNSEAAESFHRIAFSDASPAMDACRSWRYLSRSPRLLSDPWFGEFYTAPEYRRRNDVSLLPAELRIGRQVDAENRVDVYGSLRFNYDNRSRGGDASNPQDAGPVVVFDNAAILAGGIRAQPWERLPVTVFAEAGMAHDLQYRGRARDRDDLRGGVLLYDEWNVDMACPQQAVWPFRFVADLYGEAIYFSRYDDSVIFYLRGRPGLRLMEAEQAAVDGYLHLAAGADTTNTDGNRFLEAGAGLALRVQWPLPLVLRGEAVEVMRSDIDSYFDIRTRMEYAVRF